MKQTKMDDNRPKIKPLSKAQLAQVKEPSFQRWLVEKNLKELQKSIEESGILRVPVIAFIKSENIEIILDGNHLRNIFLQDERYKDDDVFSCIYCEYQSMSEAGIAFCNLNTKGKQLDLIDICNLHMHISKEKNSVYEIIWDVFLKNPSKLADIEFKTGFKMPTIVEILCKNKTDFRLGHAKKGEDFIPRKNLLQHLIDEAPSSWDDNFNNKGLKAPTGAAIVGFVTYWFSRKKHKDYSETEFLQFVNEVYLKHQDELQTRRLTINRDNAGALMEECIKLSEGVAI